MAPISAEAWATMNIRWPSDRDDFESMPYFTEEQA